jgi:hypothetical protein
MKLMSTASNARNFSKLKGFNMKKATAMVMAWLMVCSVFAAATPYPFAGEGVVYAEEGTQTETVYIPQNNFGQIGGIAAGYLRSGVSARSPVGGFTADKLSYWNGKAVGSSGVGAGRALFMRLDIPENINPKWIDKMTLEFTVYEKHNDSAFNYTLFTLNEPLPETVASINTQDTNTVKAAYSFKEEAATSATLNVAKGTNRNVKLTFDLTEFVKAHPTLDVYEFQMLASADMLTLYDANHTNESFRPKFTLEYTEKSATFGLEAAVAEAEALSEANYTAGSFGALTTALQAARTVIANGENATSGEIEIALIALNTAITDLVDLRALKAAIIAAEDAVGVGDITDLLTRANAVAVKPNATQAEVNEIQAELVAALSRGLIDPLHIATYYGQKPTMLPATVNGETVTWDEMEDEEFNKLYGTVQVKGTLASGGSVTATVEIVPSNMVYFIDSGTGADWKSVMLTSNNQVDRDQAYELKSAPHSAISLLANGALYNETSDQQYAPADGDTWGFVHEVSGGRPKALQTYPAHNSAAGFSDNMIVDDKYTVGLRASTADNFAYMLTLPAGTYTLTTGFREFFNGAHTREMTPTLTNAETGAAITTFAKVSMVNATTGFNASGTFTLNEETKVKIQYAKSGGENGSMNWLAVAEGNLPAPILNRAALRRAIADAEIVRNDGKTYASKSQDMLDRTYNQAVELLDDYETLKGLPQQAAQTIVDVIAANLNVTINTRVERNYDPDRYNRVPVRQQWLDTEGAVIQAHGGGFLEMADTDGTPIYYWIGEDKGHNRAAFIGVTLYSSKDLLNWDFRGTLLAADYKNVALLPNKVIERPKLIYNEKTGKYVLWAHWESKDYSASQIAVATSDTVDGEYEFIGHWRPGAQEGYKNWGYYQDGNYFDEPDAEGNRVYVTDVSDSSLWGYPSRDMTVFVDGEDAYLASLGRIYKLNEEFTDVDAAAMTPYLMPDGHNHWEAPALAKFGDYYFLVGSGQSGWSPNQNMYYYTKDIEDPNGWAINPDRVNGRFYLGNNSTYHSQSTNIMSISGETGTSYIYMGDHWIPSAQKDSSYVWLPMTLEGGDTDQPRLSMNYYSGWSLDVENGLIVLPEDEMDMISAGKPVEINVAESSANPLANASDGDYDTFFAPDPARAPLTYTIDLGAGEDKLYNLSRFDLSTRLVNGSEGYYHFTVEISIDGADWVEQIDNRSNIEQGFKSGRLTGQARYVRLNILGQFRKDGTANQFFGISEVAVYGTPADKLDGLVTFTGPDSVVANEPFDIVLGLNTNARNIYAHGFTVNFDPSQLEYIASETLKPGFSIVGEQLVEPGKITFISIDLNDGDEETPPGHIELLKLQFKAKQPQQAVSGSVYLTEVVLANESGNETEVSDPTPYEFEVVPVSKAELESAVEAATTLHNDSVEGNGVGQYPIGSKQALWDVIVAAKTVLNSNEATQAAADQALSELNDAVAAFASQVKTVKKGDLNGDGRIGIGDLALMTAVYYGKAEASESESDWSNYKKADLNDDGVIDIQDLRKLAQIILN